MTVTLEIRNGGNAPGQRVEAAAEMHWYAQSGYYRLSVVGYGDSEDAAIKSASLMLGQARAALTVAMIDVVPCRVTLGEETESAEG